MSGYNVTVIWRDVLSPCWACSFPLAVTFPFGAKFHSRRSWSIVSKMNVYRLSVGVSGSVYVTVVDGLTGSSDAIGTSSYRDRTTGLSGSRNVA